MGQTYVLQLWHPGVRGGHWQSIQQSVDRAKIMRAYRAIVRSWSESTFRVVSPGGRVIARRYRERYVGVQREVRRARRRG